MKFTTRILTVVLAVSALSASVAFADDSAPAQPGQMSNSAPCKVASDGTGANAATLNVQGAPAPSGKQTSGNGN
jgi:nitrous oxide reductase accessory protein NosL